MVRQCAPKTLHNILSSYAAVIPYPQFTPLDPQSQARVVAYFARPARRWCVLKDTLDSMPVESSTDQDSFANRKLIRPTLTRAEGAHSDHGHNHGHNHSPAERRDRDRDRDRDVPLAPGPRKSCPPSRPTPRIFITRSRCSRRPHGHRAARWRRSPRLYRVVRQALHQAEPQRRR